jgi:hypothetical protein
MRVLTSFFILGLTASLAAPAAEATTLTLPSTATIARHASRVAAGTVTSTVAYRRGSRIWTQVTLASDDDGAPVVFDHAGGTVDGVTMVVLGMPRFEIGERVVVLLAKRADRLRLIGLGDGKLQVTSERGRARVRLRMATDAAADAVDLADALTYLRGALPAGHPGR